MMNNCLFVWFYPELKNILVVATFTTYHFKNPVKHQLLLDYSIYYVKTCLDFSN